ncbi:hypothetical protein A5740_19100 [Mycobacterium sp. GA-1841]|uniref:DUF7159 family protein n=1 Tax=Mycobacterium sp. GA-1841 TaxID=1834154 RepID=UPI00096EA18A|nr:hypothetical protein [Mycobacterium sp. GA-1841]OMC28948.1 hypothetical protein A5740_19100 [Mycobacterium sp. GA-1841]
MDVVIGIAMTSRDARLLLVEGACGDGTVIDHDSFEVDTRIGVEQPGFSEHVVSAVLGTYAAASATRNTVVRVVLTWTDAVSIEAKLVLDSLLEAGITNVAVASASDALEAAAEYMCTTTGRNSIALCVVEPDATMLAVTGVGEDGAQHLRSRTLDDPDEATAVLALRGICDSFGEPIDAVVIAGSVTGLESLVEEANSVMERPVALGDDAAFLMVRGAILAGADTPPPEPDEATGSIFVPRAARLPTPGTEEPDAAPTAVKDPLVRTLTMIVATAVLVLAGSLVVALAVEGGDGDPPTQASKPAARAEPLAPPAPAPEPPPVLMPPPNIVPAVAAPPMAPAQPPNPLLVAALSNPQINAVAQKVVPPAVHAAQTPITVPHTDITLPALTEMIGK